MMYAYNGDVEWGRAIFGTMLKHIVKYELKNKIKEYAALNNDLALLKSLVFIPVSCNTYMYISSILVYTFHPCMLL